MRITKLLTLLLFTAIYSFGYSQDRTNSNPIGTVSINANSNIEKLLKTKFNLKNNSNYKIQLYYGSLNKAHDVLNKFNGKHKEWKGKIEYETPNYKVWVGNFQSRIEADKALMEISKNFPHAFIFKPDN